MHPGEIAELQLLQAYAQRLSNAPHGGRSAIADEGSKRLGVSMQTFYARLRTVGFSSGRKLRSDKGDSRVSLDEVKTVAAMLQASRRTTGKGLLPVCDAMDVAATNGLLTETVSATTMLRLMRREGCHPAQLAQPTPHVVMRSLHPNHVWQLDASICVLYYLRNGQAAVLDERTFNARKPRDLAKVSNLRVMRYAATDHYSGAVIARYYEAAGEDQQTLFDFLMFAMQAAPGRTVHGVPWMLVWDAGSANQSHGVRNLLDQLAVQHWAHIPGNPRAKGQIECIHNVIERKFEGRLTFTRVEGIAQLNAHLDTWLRAFNGSAILRRHGHQRDAVWQTIRTDQLRLCPPIGACALLLHTRPEPRVVAGNLTITFKVRGHERATYSVANVPSVRVGERVEVVANPYRAPAIYIVGKDEDGDTRFWECEPLTLDAGGFISTAPVFGDRYSAQADTDIDRARKDANEAAYGERDTLDATAAKTKGAIAFNGRIDPFADVREKAEQTPAYMQRRGTELHLPNPMHVELVPIDLVSALLELRSRLGRNLEPAESAAVRAWFPDGVPPEELDGLVARVEQLQSAGDVPAPNHAPRLVAVR